MDFNLQYTAEQEAFREQVRRWIADNAPAGLNEWPADIEESAQKYLQRRALGRLLGERGWLYPNCPKEYGGGGMALPYALVLEEEFHRIGLRLPPYYDAGGRIGGATIQVWGTEEQKQLFLPPIYRGEVRTWQLLSEPGAGSDLANVATTAVADGDHYVLNGTKVFIGSAHGCDRMWLLAVTDQEAPRHHNLAWFMLDAESEGITIHPQPLLSTVGEGEGDVGWKNTVFLDNVRVPAITLVGGVNNGWTVANTHLDVEHGAMGVVARDRLWGRLLEHCITERGVAERERQGRLADDPDVLDALADVYVRIEKIRLLGLRNYWQSRVGEKQTYEGSQLEQAKKVYGLEMTRTILEALGPAALTKDELYGAMHGHAEEQQREGIVYTHPGGTVEVHRLIISRRLGLGRDDPEAAGKLAAPVPHKPDNP